MSNKNKEDRLSIYIAGPDVFGVDDLEMGKAKVEICEKYGFNGLYPSFLLPEDLFSGNYDSDYVGEIVNERCLDGIKKAEIILGNMTPFRGREMDSGTAFEMGFAKALDKIIYGYSMDNRTYIERMQQDEGGVFVDDRGTYRDRTGYAIENVNEGENSMISKSCKVKMITPGKGENLTMLELFEKAVIMIKCDLEYSKTKVNTIGNKSDNQLKV